MPAILVPSISLSLPLPCVSQYTRQTTSYRYWNPSDRQRTPLLHNRRSNICATRNFLILFVPKEFGSLRWQWLEMPTLSQSQISKMFRSFRTRASSRSKPPKTRLSWMGASIGVNVCAVCMYVCMYKQGWMYWSTNIWQLYRVQSIYIIIYEQSCICT